MNTNTHYFTPPQEAPEGYKLILITSHKAFKLAAKTTGCGTWTKRIASMFYSGFTRAQVEDRNKPFDPPLVRGEFTIKRDQKANPDQGWGWMHVKV